MKPGTLTEAEIVERLRAGESQRSVAAACGLNPVTVGRIGKAAGLTFPRGQASAEARRGRRIQQTERAFAAQIEEVFRLFGWRFFHPWHNVHSAPGFPDYCAIRPPRCLFVELKTNTGRLTPAQEDWLRELARCPGVEVFLWRPQNWEAIIETLSDGRVVSLASPRR